MTVDGIVPYEAAPVGLQGDFNNDRLVNAADYTVWRDNLGGDSAILHGNGSGGTIVGEDDYNVWRANFGNSGASVAFGPAATVPEPGTFALGAVCIGMCGTLRMRHTA